MSLTRRDLLKRTGLLASALGIAVALPEVAEAVEAVEARSPEPDRVLGYWHCRKCGWLNTQHQQICKTCKNPLDGETQMITASTKKTIDTWQSV